MIVLSFQSQVLVLQSVKGACIKNVGEEAGGFYKFFKNIFIAQEISVLNISLSTNFFGKYFKAPPINVSFLYQAFL